MVDDTIPGTFGPTSVGGAPLQDQTLSGFFGGSGNLGALAAGGIGAAGLGAILGRGESPLPWEYTALVSGVPALQQNAQTLFGESQQLEAGGQQALQMAERGQLTPEQAAQVGQFGTGLENIARQTYAGMGRNPNQDTSFISTQANIDAQVNAMAQEQIRTTLQTAFGELSAASSFSGQALAESTAANNILYQAGQAQLQQDKNYSDSLTSVFASIGKIFGAVLGGKFA